MELAFLTTAWWLAPLLLLRYSLLMLFNPRRQLPHDLIAATVVVGLAVPTASKAALDQVRAQYGDLPSPDAKVLLGDLDQLRRRSRGALHLASIPMLLIGLIAFGAAVANWDNALGAFEISMIYWGLAGPLGRAVTAWWFGRQQQRRSAVTAWRSTLVIAIVVARSSSLTLFLPVGGFLTGAGCLISSHLSRIRPRFSTTWYTIAPASAFSPCWRRFGRPPFPISSHCWVSLTETWPAPGGVGGRGSGQHRQRLREQAATYLGQPDRRGLHRVDAEMSLLKELLAQFENGAPRQR